jgi:hypothetical protein
MWCATYDDSICLQWNQRLHSITVPLDPKSSNVGTIWTVTGYSKHHRFCNKLSLSHTEENIAMDITLFNDMDRDDKTINDPTPQSQKEMYSEKGSI